MSKNTLSDFIVSYIAGRKQPKLEAFEKEAEKKLAALSDAEEIAAARQDIMQQRQQLESRYEVRNWLTDAASRAGQISLVTHAIKFTHSDAKGSSIFSVPQPDAQAQYLSGATLAAPAIDAVGNAAALDIAKLLQTEHEGDSLIACLNRDDNAALAALAENEQQLEAWVSGFKQVLINKQPATHKLAKQLYFPIGDGQYHLLSPLFSSSLAHALHQRIIDARFSDRSKDIYQAFRDKAWHPEPRVIYPKTAIQNIGGTKPQNISYLNSVRGGKAFLLPCSAPEWQAISRPPLKHKSLFHDGSEFSRLARSSVWQMQQYLLSVQDKNNADIRQRRLAYTDEIIDILFNYAASVQNLTDWKAWSQREECELKRSQQLWLDPQRAQVDEVFRVEREGGSWKEELAFDFGYWLNRKLKHEKLQVGAVERLHFSSSPLFRQRLREFEQDAAEVLR